MTKPMFQADTMLSIRRWSKWTSTIAIPSFRRDEFCLLDEANKSSVSYFAGPFSALRMEKIGAKSIIYGSLLMLLMLQFSSLVGAVDITFYENISSCSGPGYTFGNISSNICCVVTPKDGGSVEIDNTSGSEMKSYFFRGYGCSNSSVRSGSGNFCIYGGEFSGAWWYTSARRRSLLGEVDSQKCNSRMKPTGVVFTEDGMKGSWILTTSDAAKVYSQMKHVPDEKKANWLKSRGATYKQTALSDLLLQYKEKLEPT